MQHEKIVVGFSLPSVFQSNTNEVISQVMEYLLIYLKLEKASYTCKRILSKPINLTVFKRNLLFFLVFFDPYLAKIVICSQDIINWEG